MQSKSEVEQGKTYTAEELREELGLPPDVRDPDEKELARKVRAAEYNYGFLLENVNLENYRSTQASQLLLVYKENTTDVYNLSG